MKTTAIERPAKCSILFEAGAREEKKRRSAPKRGISEKRIEKGAVRKRWHGRIAIALVYPNTYPVGMGNLGFQTVYAALNGYDHIVAERVFLPGKDVTARERGAVRNPWRSEESGRTLPEFDLVLFSISFETDYLHVPEAVEDLGFALRAADRPDKAPLVLAGGVATMVNPEPLAPLIDAFLLGDFEEMDDSFASAASGLADRTRPRFARLRALQKAVPGVYLPETVSPVADTDGTISEWSVKPGFPFPVKPARSLRPPSTVPYSTIVSSGSVFRDMFLVELSRGCGRGCRFCAAGFVYRPPRPWPVGSLKSALEKMGDVKRIGLVGLEFLGREEVERLCGDLLASGKELAFSSLRADALTPSFVSLLAASRARVATIAPEAGSERLRRVINKNLDEGAILRAAELLVRGGIPNLRLYFMIGLPFETDDDIREMVALVDRVRKRVLSIGKSAGHVGTITVSVNTFVPKAWTPMQWAGFASERVLGRRRKILRKGLAALPNVRLTLDSLRQAKIQAVLSRGDRRLCAVIETAAKGFSWRRAMRKSGLTNEEYLRERGEEEKFPWEVVGHPVGRHYLLAEWKKAGQGRQTSFCDTLKCKRCGACLLI